MASVPAITVRLGTPADASAISAFITALSAKFIAHEFTAPARERFLATLAPDALESYLTAGFRFHVAERDGEIAGVVATRDDRHLYHLFVAEALHGSGLGRRLWGIAREASQAAGHDGDFTVNASRFAVGFYERLGFRLDGDENEVDGVVSVPMRFGSPST